jgi:hypothetical protein
MRRCLIAASVFVATSGLVACYDSESPIDPEPQLEVEQRLLGAWRCLPSAGKVTDKPATMTVTQLRPRVYSVLFDEDRYEGYSSVVQGRTIANVKSLSSRQGKPWSFVSYTFLRPTVLQLQVLSDEAIDEEHPPSSLRHALEKLPGSSYEDFAVCVRAAEK